MSELRDRIACRLAIAAFRVGSGEYCDRKRNIVRIDVD